MNVDFTSSFNIGYSVFDIFLLSVFMGVLYFHLVFILATCARLQRALNMALRLQRPVGDMDIYSNAVMLTKSSLFYVPAKPPKPLRMPFKNFASSSLCAANLLQSLSRISNPQITNAT